MSAFSGICLLVGLTSALYLSNSLIISMLFLYKSFKSILLPSLSALMGAPYFNSRRTISI